MAIEYVLDVNSERTEPSEPERPVGAMSPVEIWAYMQAAGRMEPKMEIQVTTYDLWKRRRIDHPSVGREFLQLFQEPLAQLLAPEVAQIPIP